MGGAAKLFSAFGAPASKYFNPVLFGNRAAADGTTTPLLRVLQSGGAKTTADLLVNAAKLAGKGAVEGAAFSVGGQIASGDNPYSPKDASANTDDDLSSAGSLAGIQAILGTVVRGRSLREISKGVDDIVDQVNQSRTNPPDGQAPQPPVDRATVIGNLIQQNQIARAQQSFADLQKQTAAIDSNDSLSMGQKLGMKMKAAAQVPAELRPAVLAHLDAAADAQRQTDEAMKAADAEVAKLPPAIPALANRSDAYIAAHAQDILAFQQTGQPRQLNPIPTRQQGQRSQALQSFLTDSDILAEFQRRQQLAQLNEQRQQVVTGIASKLNDSLDQTVALSQTPEGRSAILELDRYNAQQPNGSSKATASTVQSAMDLAPAPAGNLSLPPVYINHYLPVAHQIEQLGDPVQQTALTASIKLANGRALNSDEQGLMLGGAPDPQTGEPTPPAVDATTGNPLAKVVNGKPVLTDAGLDRLKQLVPAAADILPRNEQAQLEAQPPPLPKQPAKAAKGPTPTIPASPSAPAPSTVTGNGGAPTPRPQRGLAHYDDETLQTKIGSMQAAMQNAEARGAQFPPDAKRHLAELQQEAAARASRTSAPVATLAGLPQGHQVDDTVSFTRPDGTQARGEVTEVHSDHYRVATDDGIEHRVPIVATAQRAQGPGGRQTATRKIISDFRAGKADEATTRRHLANVGVSPEEIEKRLAPPAAKNTQSEPKQVSPPRSLKARGLERRDLVGAAAVAGVPDAAPAPMREKAAELWAQKGVESPFFKRWFGLSWVVNQDGKPKRVFHGTAQSFDRFDPRKLGENTDAPSSRHGFFFTDDPRVASGYADTGYREEARTRTYEGPDRSIEDARQMEELSGRHGPDIHESPITGERQQWPINRVAVQHAAEGVHALMKGGTSFRRAMEIAGNYDLARAFGGDFDVHDGGQGGNVIPSYLSIKNPLVHDFRGQPYRERTYNALLKQAKAEGRDGVFLLRTFDDPSGNQDGPPHDVYVAFHPTQIKSATGNRGTFDAGDPRIVAGAGVRPVAGIDLGGNSLAEARDNFDPEDVDTWPISEDERDRLRQFSGEPGDNDEFNNLSDTVDQMKENGWPEAIVAKAQQLRDEMEGHLATGNAELKARGKELKKYLGDSERQIAHDTDFDDPDTWPESIKEKWDDLDLTDPATWPAGIEADARRDGALAEEPLDEDEPNGEKSVDLDQDYAQAWMADHLVAPRVRQAIAGLPDGADIENVRRGRLLDSLARTEAEQRLAGSGAPRNRPLSRERSRPQTVTGCLRRNNGSLVGP